MQSHEINHNIIAEAASRLNLDGQASVKGSPNRNSHPWQARLDAVNPPTLNFLDELKKDGSVPNLVQQYAPRAKHALRAASTFTHKLDITDTFTKAAAALEIGQLVKDEDLTLFESVGALEIMDPKMDSGLLQPNENLEETYDVLRDLSPEEVIGIMDQLFCHEIAWHHGYPLSQTIFTSVYIDRLLWPEPKILEHAQFSRNISITLSPWQEILRTYCLALIKCCHLSILRVTSRDYYEEEDFNTHTFNRDLLMRIPEQSLQDLLTDAIEYTEDLFDDENIASVTIDTISAISLRLNMRLSMLRTSSSDLEPQEALQAWTPIAMSVPEFKGTHSLGKSVPDSFSPKIQRTLASTVPPRPIVNFSFEDACEKLLQICADCEEAARLSSIEAVSPYVFRAFVWAYNSRNPTPLAYPRAYLSSILMNNPDDLFEEFLRQELGELLIPEDPVLEPVNWALELPRNHLIPKDPRIFMQEIIDEFTKRALPAYLEFWNALCQNRCRTRRHLCHTIQAFEALQNDCESLDVQLHELREDILQYPLSQWAYLMKLTQMELIVELGLEQELYKIHELAGIYWWLRETKFMRVEVLERIRASVLRKHALIETDISRKTENVSRAKLFATSLLLEAKASGFLAEATSLLYIILSYVQLIPHDLGPYGNAKLHWELRMKPFLTLDTPAMPTAERVHEATQPYGSYDGPLDVFLEVESSLFQKINELTGQARSMWQAVKKLGAGATKSDPVEQFWSKTLAAMQKTSIALTVATAAVQEVCDSKGAREAPKHLRIEIPEAGQRYHDSWIIPKVVKL